MVQRAVDACGFVETPAKVVDLMVDDPSKTFDMFRKLPQRKAGHTHVRGYDFVLLVPMFVDNVNPPYVAWTNSMGVDLDRDYATMLDQICRAYRARWHM